MTESGKDERHDLVMAIDVGNTHTVSGLFEDRDLIKQWREGSEPERTSDECGLLPWAEGRLPFRPQVRNTDQRG